MNIIPPHDHFDASHLEWIKSKMLVLGVPSIKAVWVEAYNAWVALEGCHRLHAAKALGLVPIIEPIEYDEDLTTDDVVPGSYDDTWSVARICDDAYNIEPLVF